MFPRKCTKDHNKISFLLNLFAVFLCVGVTAMFASSPFLITLVLIVAVPVFGIAHKKNIKDRILLKIFDIDTVYPTLFRHSPGDVFKRENEMRYRYAGVVDNEFIAYTDYNAAVSDNDNEFIACADYDAGKEARFMTMHVAEYMRNCRNRHLNSRINTEKTASIGRKLQENPKNESHKSHREARKEIPVTHRLQA